MKAMKNDIVSAVASIIVGVLLIMFKDAVVSIAMTALGITLMISGALDIVNKYFQIGILKAIFGVLVLIFGWLFIKIALIFIGAVLIYRGALALYAFRKSGDIYPKLVDRIFIISAPILNIAAGVCFILNQSASLMWIFILAGFLMVADGVMELLRLAKR